VSVPRARALWKIVLIVEDDSDGRALRALAAATGVRVTIDWLPANGIGNIQRKAAALIRLAQDRIERRGCVAVVVDGDGRDPTVDEPHRSIQQACRAAGVPLILAREALEAWFLADPGICTWLGLPARVDTATLRDPKRIVADAYYARTRRAYQQRRARLDVAQRASGPDSARNGSLLNAMGHLAGCRVTVPVQREPRRAAGG
jgi:hypothetical protein